MSYRRVMLALLAIGIPTILNAQVTVADYERARGLQKRFEGLVTNAPDAATWLSPTKFWYRKAVIGGNEFVVIDATTLQRKPAFDHARLATVMSTVTKRLYEPKRLPFSTFSLGTEENRIVFVADDSSRWTCTLADYHCEPSTASQGGRGQGGRGQGAGGGGGMASPDGKRIAFVQSNNIYVRTGETGSAAPVTRTGTAAQPFVSQSIVWSPDSRKLAAYRVTPGDRRMVRYVESSPSDQLQPKTFERFYAKPGDVVDRQQPVLIDVEGNLEIQIDSALYPNPYALSRIEWRKDSRSFTFEYNQRGHQVYRVIDVDAATGTARPLVEETSKAFIDYRRANGNLTDSGRLFRYDLNDGREIIWMSERDGWAHLYLYDGLTGRVKNQITRGSWLVRGVVRVDEATRQIVFSAGGIDPKQDPYFSQYFRINFDGTGLTALTEANGNHVASFAPDNRYYVDTWSRVDMAPVSQLRRTSDAKVLMEIEKGDLSALTKAGWRAPEVFTSKGRDGATDIWGIVIRPTRFDPGKKYPVIENIYAGPQGSFVPKSFSAYMGMQALAELGFIVVQIDGMGTANRSKAFHDVAWKNLGDAGFPDRILWHKAVAKKYPWYDVTRVGIYGGSAGGQNSLGALLFHPEFYKAAASFAGCHDNRMDKIWWNEQWMGWPIGPEYAASSNTVNANKLQGKLLLVVGELDTNVDPSSTMQVANALIKSNKSFDMLVMPGEEHAAGRRGASAPYGDRKLWDFFVSNLLHTPTPNWNAPRNQDAALRVGSTPTSLFDEGGPGWTKLLASWE